MVEQSRAHGVLKDMWWLLLIRGVFAVIFGVIALAWPGITVWALVVVFGVYAIVDGLTAISRAVQNRRHEQAWVWWIVLGAVSLIAGVIALVWPAITALALLYVIAFYAIVFGVSGAMAAFRLKHIPGSGWGWMLASGVLSVLLGIWLLIAPGDGILGLILLLGGYAVVFGVVIVIAAIQLRNRAKEAGLA